MFQLIQNLTASKAIIELHFLPSLAYFFELQRHNEIILEAEENFQKQSFRNRCQILASNRTMDLVVPVIKRGSSRKIRDIRIDHSTRWSTNHWRTIQSAYGKSPFFEHFEAEFHQIFEVKEEFLYDLNHKALTICLQFLQLPLKLAASSSYEKEIKPPILDVRSTIHPKKMGVSKGLLQFEGYHQVFGSKFVPNLSIMDLLFNEGPNALNIIRKTIVLSTRDDS